MSEPPPTFIRIMAGLALLSVAADLVLKDRGDLQVVFWSCYSASFAVVLGVFLRSDWLVACGFVFFIGVGIPVWVAGRIVEGSIYPTSLLIHTVPALTGALYLGRTRRLPRHTIVGAFLLHAIALVLARFLTSPAANINLAHAVWPPVKALFPRLWQFQAVVLCLEIIFLSAAALAIDAWLRHRSSSRLRSQLRSRLRLVTRAAQNPQPKPAGTEHSSRAAS